MKRTRFQNRLVKQTKPVTIESLKFLIHWENRINLNRKLKFCLNIAKTKHVVPAFKQLSRSSVTKMYNLYFVV